MSLENNEIARDSTQYVEIIAEVFVEAFRKATRSSMGCECGGEEITPALIECLQYGFLHGAPSIREIANGLEISLSGASQLVERLVKKELVTRREDTADRRLTKVELTDAGREVVRQMRDRRSKWFESIVSAMPETKRKSFVDGLERFLQVALASEDNIDRACVRCGMEHVTFCVVNKVRAERNPQRIKEFKP